MGRWNSRPVVPAPDIDKLAKGIYGPQIAKLTDQLAQARARARLVPKLEDKLKRAREHAERQREEMAEANRKLRRENADLKLELKELRDRYGA